MIDANQGWDLPTAIEASKRCEALRHLLARGSDAVVRRAPRAAPAEVRGPHPDRRRRDGVHAVRAAHHGRGGAGRLPDHRLDVGGRADDVAQGGGHDRAVPGAAGRPPRSADPRPRGGGEPDRLHPRVIRRSHPRPALVRAVRRAARRSSTVSWRCRTRRASASSCAATRSRSTASGSSSRRHASVASVSGWACHAAASSASTRARTL